MNTSESCAIARQYRHRSIQERLASFSRDDGTGCQLWIGPSLATGGYGLIYYNSKKRLAHRVAYEVFVGPIPEGLVVRHACDKPRCINPACLSVGTYWDNEQDKRKRGRHMYGERHHKAKINEKDVLAIRSDTRNRRIIASQYGLHPGTITMIRSRRIWAHLP